MAFAGVAVATVGVGGRAQSAGVEIEQCWPRFGFLPRLWELVQLWRCGTFWWRPNWRGWLLHGFLKAVGVGANGVELVFEDSLPACERSCPAIGCGVE